MLKTLRHLRRLPSYHPDDVARHMHVSTRTLFMWETGERNISACDLRRLLALYDTDILISDIPLLFEPKQKTRGNPRCSTV